MNGRLMTFSPLVDEQSIAAAFDAFACTWTSGAEKMRKVVGWRPKSMEFDVWWRADINTWAILKKDTGKSHYYIFIGSDIARTKLTIDCQFDPAASGINRRLGGLFLRDGDGDIFLGHSGKISGGVSGVSRKHFLEFCKGKTVPITWPDGKDTEGFSLGGVNSPTLPKAMRDFADLRLKFKQEIKSAS